MTPIRRTRLLDRAQHIRDARLFVIATEGACTEPVYFNALQQLGLIDHRRIRLVLVAPEGNASAPQHVIACLHAEAAKLPLQPFDELWIVSDVDRWATREHTPNLVTMAREANDVGYKLAVSNPCFELWLLLHHEDSDCTAVRSSKDARRTLRAVRKGYNKSAPNFSDLTHDHLRRATERARDLDATPTDRWPRTTGSHVYRLVEAMWAAGLGRGPSAG